MVGAGPQARERTLQAALISAVAWDDDGQPHEHCQAAVTLTLLRIALEPARAAAPILAL